MTVVIVRKCSCDIIYTMRMFWHPARAFSAASKTDRHCYASAYYVTRDTRTYKNHSSIIYLYYTVSVLLFVSERILIVIGLVSRILLWCCVKNPTSSRVRVSAADLHIIIILYTTTGPRIYNQFENATVAVTVAITVGLFARV